MRRSIQNIGDSLLKAKAGLAECTSAHEHPDDLDGSELVHGGAVVILECKSSKQSNDKAHIGRQHMLDEPLNIVEDATSLLDGVQNGSKVVIREDDIRRFLGHIRSSSHCDAYVCSFETRNVIHAVTGHGNIALSSVKSFNHPDLRARSAACDDQGELSQVIYLGVGEGIKVVGRHHDGLGKISREQSSFLRTRKNADIHSDSTRRLRVVACEHVDNNAGSLAGANAGEGFRAGRVVNSNEAAEDEISLKHLAVWCPVVEKIGLGQDAVVDLVGQC